MSNYSLATVIGRALACNNHYPVTRLKAGLAVSNDDLIVTMNGCNACLRWQR